MSTTFEWSELTSGATLWSVCSEDVGSHYSTLYPTMKEVYLKLLSAGLRALVYNGDTDMACNFLGDQWFVEDLGLEVQPWLFSFSFPLMNGIDFTYKCAVNVCFQSTTRYQPWMYEHQVGGFYQQFGNLTFLTVKVTTSVFYFPLVFIQMVLFIFFLSFFRVRVTWFLSGLQAQHFTFFSPSWTTCLTERLCCTPALTTLISYQGQCV